MNFYYHSRLFEYNFLENYISTIFKGNTNAQVKILGDAYFSNYQKNSIKEIRYYINGQESIKSLVVLYLALNTTGNVVVKFYMDGKTTNLINMFNGCTNLIYVDCTNFNFSYVLSINYFTANCSNLISVNLSNCLPASLTSMVGTFSWCENMITCRLFDLTNTKVNLISDGIYTLFNNCHKLVSLDLTNLNFAAVHNYKYLFNCCYMLGYIKVSGIFGNIVNSENTFYLAAREGYADYGIVITSHYNDFTGIFGFGQSTTVGSVGVLPNNWVVLNETNLGLFPFDDSKVVYAVFDIPSPGIYDILSIDFLGLVGSIQIINFTSFDGSQTNYDFPKKGKYLIKYFLVGECLGGTCVLGEPLHYNLQAMFFNLYHIINIRFGKIDNCFFDTYTPIISDLGTFKYINMLGLTLSKLIFYDKLADFSMFLGPNLKTCIFPTDMKLFYNLNDVFLYCNKINFIVMGTLLDTCLINSIFNHSLVLGEYYYRDARGGFAGSRNWSKKKIY